MAASAVARKPSCSSPSQARRLLRQSQCASACGTAVPSTPSTRPIWHASGAWLMSFARKPPRMAANACAWASRPRPIAEVAVAAETAMGGMDVGVGVGLGSQNRRFAPQRGVAATATLRRSGEVPDLAKLAGMSEQTDRVVRFLRELQDRICRASEAIDGSARFVEDAWQRPAGGGGRTRVLKGGGVFEQAGVNFSRVHGTRLPPSASAHRPQLAGRGFIATGVSLVLHPRNPHEIGRAHV